MASFKERVGRPLKEVWHSRLPLLIWLLSLHILSAIAVLSSFTPSLLTNYFANLGPGIKVDCSDKDKSTKQCHSATNEVLFWKCGVDFITNIVLGIFLSPTLGTWSDLVGRKPFIALGCVLGPLPGVVILCHLKLGLPLWWYFVAQIFVQPFSPITPTFSVVADVISPSGRTVAFALLGISFPIAFTVGPILVATDVISGPIVAAYVGLGCSITSALGVLIFFRESLSAENMKSANRKIAQCGGTHHGWYYTIVQKPLIFFRNSISLLFRSKLFVKLTICILVLYVNFEEVYEMEAQYFQEVAGFGPKDLANLFATAGVASWVTITVGLWMLVTLFRMTDKQVLIFGMCMLALQQILYAFIRSKIVIYAVTAVGTSANLVLPAISGIKSTIVGADEQGALQGAIQSARSLASGFGPILFLSIFYVFRSGDLYVPGAPFVFGFILLLVGIVIACTLELPRPSSGDFGSKKEEPLLTDDTPHLKSFRIIISSDEED